MDRREVGFRERKEKKGDKRGEIRGKVKERGDKREGGRMKYYKKIVE